MERHEELLTGGGRQGGDGRAEGLSAIGDGEQAAISLMPDVDGTGFGSFLEPDACSHLLKICNLKVHMEGTYCIISNRADQKKKRYHLARATVAS